MTRESVLEGPVRADDEATPTGYICPCCGRAQESTTAERGGRSVKSVNVFEFLGIDFAAEVRASLLSDFCIPLRLIVPSDQPRRLQLRKPTVYSRLRDVLDVERDRCRWYRYPRLFENLEDSIIGPSHPRHHRTHLKRSSPLSVKVLWLSDNLILNSVYMIVNSIKTYVDDGILWWYESYTRTRRYSGPSSENEPDPAVWAAGPDGLSWIGTKAMQANDSRGLENSVRRAESTENHYSCPHCGEPVESISANAPGAHELGCGCEATISTRDAVKATATRLITDGGRQKTPQKSGTEADTCSCCGEPFSRLGRLCADCWAANCNSFIEGCRAEDPTPITDGGTVACQNQDCGLVAVVEVQTLEATEGRKLCESCAIQELRPGKAVPDGGIDTGAKIQGYFEEETVHVAGHQCRAAAVPADDGHALRMVYECQQCGYASNQVTGFAQNACEVAE